MLLDKKVFWEALRTMASDELHEQIQTNASITKTEKAIEELMKANNLHERELDDEYRYLIQEYSSLAYIQGLQAGAKMFHLLLSGEAVNHMQRVEGTKVDDTFDYRKAVGG